MTVQAAGETLEKTVFFGSAEMQGAGLSLSRLGATCVFGDVHIDLRSAQLAEDVVRLEAFILFGLVSLRIPASWRVITELQPLFGSVEESGVAPAAQADAPMLRIGGTVMFASFELERF